MNVKKLLATGASAALLLAAAMPAFANGGWLIENSSHLTNNLATTANSGYNEIKSWHDDVEGGKIKTGDAFAGLLLENIVNTNEVSLCGCDGEESLGIQSGGSRLIKNSSHLTNNIETLANSGYNKIKAKDDVEGGRISTGGADAEAAVSNVVNTNMVSL